MLNYKLKIIFQFITIQFVTVLFCYSSSVMAASPWDIYSGTSLNIPQITNYDNETIQKLKNIKKEFNSGDTISAAEMNEKFLNIFLLLEELTNMSIDSEPVTSIIVFGSQSGMNGDLGGLNGANQKCNSDPNKTSLENYGNITCTNTKAIIETNNQTIESIYPDTAHKFYGYKGNLISESWNGFLSTPLSNFTNYSEVIWYGKNGDDCNGWTTGENNEYRGTTGRVNDGEVISIDGSQICSAYKYLLCSCQFYSN